jgi:DNA-binding MarR family transcriptional regulator
MPKGSTAAKTQAANADLSQLEHFAKDLRLDQQPGFMFRRLDNRATSLFEKMAGVDDLTARQFGVLLTLFQNGRMTQGALAAALYVDRSTLAEMLQRMVDRGLVRRRMSRNDRRMAELWLWPEGKKALLASVKQVHAVQRLMISPLPAEYRPLFLKCLAMLSEAEIGEPDL